MRAMIASLLAVAGVLSPAGHAAAEPEGHVRVDQVGYALGETKHAYLLATTPADGATFRVVDAFGRTVHSGRIGTGLGAWNARYPALHQIDLTPVRVPGAYRITVGGGARATSPVFRVDTASALFAPLTRATNEFFQVQRDGADVLPGRVRRKPAHLTDRAATVYAEPKFKGGGGDIPAEPLKPIGGPVDVEGGWFDAGDFVKFTSNTAYALAEMGFVLRERYDHALHAEVRHGLKWLDKMWDARTGTLYAQVGIGTGSEEFGFLGDHDVWRLPEADDRLDAPPGSTHRFIKYRPVFRAGPSGEPISPNLAGRVAAAFAIGAQFEAGHNRALARRYLDEAASIFAGARTENVGQLVTAYPHAYYPESSWTDDMELGAAELALAGRRLGDARAGDWALQATRWARAYLDGGDKETLNLYDTSALAHAELVRVLRSGVQGARVTEAELVGDLRRQLDVGRAGAARSPFRTAVDVTEFDAASRSFGFAATARLYQRITGDRSYDAFGVRQRNFALGANAWGMSLVVGVGSRFPHCVHHQVANLAGSLDGGHRVIVGAVVNGPNGTDNFTELDIPPGARPCATAVEAFDTPRSRFVDDVRAWGSVEPAIDFTSTAMLAFALSH